MAQAAPNAQRAQNSQSKGSLTFQQLLQGEASNWSPNSLQKQKKNHDQEDDGNHHNKKSVLAKVKEKAKKLKHSLSGKKRRDENELRGPSATPSLGVGPEDKEQEDAEYHGALMYESKHAPDAYKQAARDHPQEAPIATPEKHAATSNAEERRDEPASSSNTTTETPSNPSIAATHMDAKNQAPAIVNTSEVHDLPESTGSRFSGLTISTPASVTKNIDGSIEGRENMRGESQTWDKGVSVKEYLMHKFEPGEDERALSQVITQTISPRRDKMREAMSSFLKNEEPSESTNKLSNSAENSSTVPTNLNPNLKSKSAPASANLNTHMGSKIASLNPNRSLGSDVPNASSNLNQTFKLTVASYQNHNFGSSPNHNMGLNSSATSSSPNANPGSNQSSTLLHSPTKTLSPLVNASTANQTQAPTLANTDATQIPVSSANHTQVPSYTDTNTIWAPVSTANQTQAPCHTDTNATQAPVSTANQTQVPSHTDTNATQVPVSMASQTGVPGHTDANAARASISAGNQAQTPVYTNANTTGVPPSTNTHEVVEDENCGRILQAN